MLKSHVSDFLFLTQHFHLFSIEANYIFPAANLKLLRQIYLSIKHSNPMALLFLTTVTLLLSNLLNARCTQAPNFINSTLGFAQDSLKKPDLRANLGREGVESGARREVGAGLADRGEDFLEHPALEGDGGRQRAADDQAQNVGLGQNPGFLSSAKGIEDGVAFHHPTAMLLHRVGWVSVAKRKANVLGDKQRLGLAAAEDEVVQAGFVDDGHFLRSRRGGNLISPLHSSGTWLQRPSSQEPRQRPRRYSSWSRQQASL